MSNNTDCTLDLETRSILDLRVVSTWTYAEHPSTECYLMRYAFPNDLAPRGWRLGEPMPDDLRDWINGGGRLEFHNDSFEAAMWSRFFVARLGWPEIDHTQMADTMARANAVGLPSALERATGALGLIGKDTEGAKAMKALMKPVRTWCLNMETGNYVVTSNYGTTRHDIANIDHHNSLYAQGMRAKAMQRPRLETKIFSASLKQLREAEDPFSLLIRGHSHWYEDFAPASAKDTDNNLWRFHQFDVSPDLLEECWDYCGDDVLAQQELSRVLPPLGAMERAHYELTLKSNLRGVRVNQTAVDAALEVVAAQQVIDKENLREVTQNAVRAPTNNKQLLDWLNHQGFEVTSVAKDTITALLERDDLPGRVRRALTLRQQGNKSSVAKLPVFQRHTCADGRLRSAFVYHGAQKTGRLTSRGVQLHNLPSRGGVPWRLALEVLRILEQRTIKAEDKREMIELLYGPPLDVLSSVLRLLITASDGMQIHVADYSNIEGRVAAWLAGEDWKLKAFADYDTWVTGADGKRRRKGYDLYIVAAAGILGIRPEDVSKPMRNALGKVSELSMQFQGGVGAFLSMAKVYNVQIGDYWAHIKETLPPDVIKKLRRAWDTRGKKSGTDKQTWLAAEAVKMMWRRKHPCIEGAWYAFQDAAINAVNCPDGRAYEVLGGRAAFQRESIGSKPFLTQRLPSGRKLWLAEPKVNQKPGLNGHPQSELTYMGTEPTTKRWVRLKTYGGDLFQSHVQGTARDVMMNGWANADKAGFNMMLNVHDELAGEREHVDLGEFQAAMEALPEWAAGLPVTAEGYTATEFRKD